jgi:hypothetical protein
MLIVSLLSTWRSSSSSINTHSRSPYHEPQPRNGEEHSCEWTEILDSQWDMLYRKGLLILLKSICTNAGLALKPVPHLQHVTKILACLSGIRMLTLFLTMGPAKIISHIQL